MTTIHNCDAQQLVNVIEPKSVQCCITSPPYWGLRDYGVEGQLGLESTPEEYVDKLVSILRGVKEALRDDGTLWLNLGDSYCGTGHKGDLKDPKYPGLKSKDLVGIPWRVAFALQADGWYLRSDIIWEKPNCMPESVNDRPTKAHEYVFLLSKNKKYYYDAMAIKEPLKDPDALTRENSCVFGGKNKHKGYGTHGKHSGKEYRKAPGGRNKRTVWTIATGSYKEAHFATFPEKLVEPMVLAGSSHKACEHCGAPWQRSIKKKAEPTPNRWSKIADAKQFDKNANGYDNGGTLGMAIKSCTTYQPTCQCDNEGTGQSVVLDPFAGSGTTLAVAERHQRSAIGIELNPEYIELIEKRLSKNQLMMEVSNGF